MNRSILLVAALMLSSVFTACGNSTSNETENTAETTTQKEIVAGPETDVISSYLKVKEALVASDANAAKTAAQVLVEKSAFLTDETMKNEISTIASVIASSDDVDVQRGQLNALSNAVYKLAKAANTGMELYYQHCPMANNGDGGYWLSSAKNIENPYYGSAMMKCGSVKETL